MIPQRYIRAILPIWIAVLILGSFLPSNVKRVIRTQPSISPSDSGPQSTLLHRVWHLASFGSTGLLASLASVPAVRRFVWCCALIGLGLAIELLQCLFYGVAVEWWDIRDDTLGLVLFMALAELAQVRRILVRP